MTMTLRLFAADDDNPFNAYGWSIDLESGSPDLTIDAPAESFPVSSVEVTLDPWTSWSAEFSPALTDPGLSGASLADLWTDGDTLIASEGDDILRLTEFDDQATGGYGNDLIDGRGGDDWLRGGADDDVVYGGEGNDRIEGLDGYDALYGGPGDDIINAGDGAKDTVYGGPGKDVLSDSHAYVFDAELGPTNIDHITKFYEHQKWTGASVIRLDRDIFGALKAGKLKGKFLDIGDRKADDRNDYLVYHEKKGALYYDADGSRKHYDPIKFLILDNHPQLSRKDFFVFDDS